MLRFLRSTMTALSSTPRVPIPANGVDYRGKVVLAPMVRSGELPTRLLALKYGADLVWGPETIDRALIGTTRRVNPRTGIVEFARRPSNGGRPSEADKDSIIYRIDPAREKNRHIFQIGTATPDLAVKAATLIAADVSGIDVNSGCPKPFSTSGGMGAALLKDPDRLVSILEALVRDVGTPFQIGISVKIRILGEPDLTEALVSRLELVVPSDEKAFHEELLREKNDVRLVELLNSVLQGSLVAEEINRKARIIEGAKSSRSRVSTYGREGRFQFAAGGRDLMP